MPQGIVTFQFATMFMSVSGLRLAFPKIPA
jgi:hypothetical protein